MKKYCAGVGDTPDARPGSRGWQMPKNVPSKMANDMAGALVSRHLRNLVDQWLETGRQPDGSESPCKRDITKAPIPALALTRYAEEAPPKYSLDLEPGGFSLNLTIAQSSWGKPWAGNFFQAQEVEAKRLWFGIMASDWKDRLCKCRYQGCGCYFLHPDPRPSYRHGTFCGKHAKDATAAASMRKVRAEGTTLLIEEAARKLGAWKCGDSWMDDVDVKRRLATELCFVILRRRLHRYRQEVKVNWVTRHRAPIEQRRLVLTLRPVS